MAVLYRTIRQGAVGTLVIDAGDNAAIDATAGPLQRLQLRAGETCSSATVTCTSYPTGAVIGAGEDLELGTPAAVSTNTECNDRIVGSGEGITIAFTFADDAPLGTYLLKGEIVTSTSRQVPFCLHLSLVGCS